MKRESERFYTVKNILEQYRVSKDRETADSLQSALELMRNHHKHGGKFYWILYYCYLSPSPYAEQDEIIKLLQTQNYDVSIYNFGGRRRAAIRTLSECYHGKNNIT